MSDGAGPLRRCLRVPVHAWQTYRTMVQYLHGAREFDVIFVPTMLVHHLLGWTCLIKRILRTKACRVILFFPNTPIHLDLRTNEPAWQPSPTAKLFARLIRALDKEVKSGRVILGVETLPMREALTHLTGVRFSYLPHPVSPTQDALPSSPTSLSCPPLAPLPGAAGCVATADQPSAMITMASYGGARHEKGCDLLVDAVHEYCRRHPDSRVRFVLQSVDGDEQLWGRLNGIPSVRLISSYFKNGEYHRQLAQTNVLLLPYRRSSYGLRGSRVVIEALVLGLPVVATAGTTLAQQAEQFGALQLCNDEDSGSLVAAIAGLERNYESFAAIGRQRLTKAREHFSVENFRNLLGHAG
jgi:glycosyltransferase involved in cell wall biosynthesis